MQATDLKKRLRILILSPERSSGSVLSNALHAIGYVHVKVMVSTKETLKLYLREKFDVMLIFLTLREANGLELIRRIRTGQTHIPRTQVIVLVETEAEAEEDSAGFGALGINAVARMPLNPKMLDDAVRHAISHEHLAQNAIDLMEQTPAPQSAKPPKGFSPEPFMLPAGALVEGMFLAESITIHGHTLAPAGTVITEAHLQVIENLLVVLENREFKVYMKASS